ncbi:MAG: hypothetical protein U0232_03645 [Thermomicrobiales bacterium]
MLGSLLTALLVLFVGMPLALTCPTPLPLEEHYAGYALDMAVGLRAGDAANPLAGTCRGDRAPAAPSPEGLCRLPRAQRLGEGRRRRR